MTQKHAKNAQYAKKPFGFLLKLPAGVAFFISSKQRCGDKEPWQLGPNKPGMTQNHCFVSFVGQLSLVLAKQL